MLKDLLLDLRTILILRHFHRQSKAFIAFCIACFLVSVNFYLSLVSMVSRHMRGMSARGNHMLVMTEHVLV